MSSQKATSLRTSSAAELLREEKQRLQFVLNYTDLSKKDINRFNRRLVELETEARNFAAEMDPELGDLFLIAADYLELCSEATQDELCAARQKLLIAGTFQSRRV